MIEGNISIEDFKNSAGAELGPSDWLLIDQERINRFADATDDYQFIHVDPEKAAETTFGSTIAHGFLSLSVLPHLLAQIMPIPDGLVMGINYGFDKVRFLAPVRAGKRVRVHAEVISVDQKDDNRFLIKQGISVEIEGEETPALVAEWLSMLVTG